jgi:cyclopropane fatty-acyl-phospholipid synthase-like methyltransferase
MELARRGYEPTGIDLAPEMAEFVEQEAKKAKLPIRVAVDDLRRLRITGVYDAAFCLMDTFRFLLTNEEIRAHLVAVAHLLAPGGLYVTDFWVPRRWDQTGNEVHQWEQVEGATTVRVFYLQHPDSVDPITQTFEDELVFEVQENGRTQSIRGGRTRTRLILPQEFAALVASSGVFELLGTYGDFDLAKPFDRASFSWRMISVLRKR